MPRKKDTPEEPEYFGIGIRLSRREIVQGLRHLMQELDRQVSGRRRIIRRLEGKRARLPRSAALRMERNDDIGMSSLSVDAGAEIQAKIQRLEAQNKQADEVKAALGFVAEHLDQKSTFVLGLDDLLRLSLLPTGHVAALGLGPGLLKGAKGR